MLFAQHAAPSVRMRCKVQSCAARVRDAKDSGQPPLQLCARPAPCMHAQALKSKLGAADSAVDAAAGAWALGILGSKDAATGKALGDALKVRRMCAL